MVLWNTPFICSLALLLSWLSFSVTPLSVLYFLHNSAPILHPRLAAKINYAPVFRSNISEDQYVVY